MNTAKKDVKRNKKIGDKIIVNASFDDLIKASVSGNPAPKPKPVKPKKKKTTK